LQRIKLGEYRPGGMSLADARDEVDRQRQIVNEYGSAKEYRDADREAKRAKLAARQDTEKRAGFTVERMIEMYLNHASDSLKSWSEVARSLRCYRRRDYVADQSV
jgi:hypothetical protein